jgi:prolyl-tRNA editing enzyme YbaK/EbsC (Cys-tRNA(Pro) deacylase)
MLHPTAAKVRDRLRERGLEVEVRELPESTRTAQEAAAAVGCDVGQIVKSLVFVDGEGAFMCLCAGDRRVDTEALAARPARADEVREATGFAIGGVPPLGHDRELRTVVDESLGRFATVWCAAGTPNAVFEAPFDALVAAIGNAEVRAV